MSFHGVPPYSRVHGFRLEQRPYGDDSRMGRLASRAYVFKTNPKIQIRSTSDSEHWTIYIMGGGPAESPGWMPHGDPFGTMTQAMLAVPALAQVIA
jgi:hypothetical protein